MQKNPDVIIFYDDFLNQNKWYDNEKYWEAQMKY